MAKLIHWIDGYGDLNFWRAFETEAKATAAGYPKPNQSMIDISSEEYAQIADGTNIPSGVVDGTINWNGTLTYEISEEQFKGEVDSTIHVLECSVRDHSSHPDVATMNAMITGLKAIDYHSINFPYTKTLEQYCSDNSISYLGKFCIP